MELFTRGIERPFAVYNVCISNICWQFFNAGTVCQKAFVSLLTGSKRIHLFETFQWTEVSVRVYKSKDE